MDGTYLIEIITTLITAGVTLAICLINNNAQNAKQRADNEKMIAVIQCQLDQQKTEIVQLKEEVRTNNSIKDRTAKLEGLALLFDNKIQNIQERLNKAEISVAAVSSSK